MARRYSPNGRFSQPDPYGGSYNFSDPQSLNRYGYVGNDPVNRKDPSGLDYNGPPHTAPGPIVALLPVGVTITAPPENQTIPDSGFSGSGTEEIMIVNGPEGGGEVGGGPQNENPRSLQDTLVGYCSLRVDFAGQGFGHKNGPGYKKSQNTAGLGFTVSGYAENGEIGVIETGNVPGPPIKQVVNPNGEWTVQQWESDSFTNVREGQPAPISGGSATRPDGPRLDFAKWDGGTFVYGDFPGFKVSTKAGKLIEGKAEFDFDVKMIKGAVSCEVRFHASMSYSRGQPSVQWSGRP